MFGLNSILRANAASCLGFGILFAIKPVAVAAYLGSPPAPDMLIFALGVILIANGAHLVWSSTRAAPARAEIYYFSGGDFAWVLATIGLILTGTWITTGNGIAASLVVAAVVGVFGTAQLVRQRGDTP